MRGNAAPVNPFLQRVSPSIAPIQPTYSEITHTGGRTVRHRKPLSVLVKLFNPSDIDSCSKDLAGARPESAPSARWTEWALRRYLAAIHRIDIAIHSSKTQVAIPTSCVRQIEQHQQAGKVGRDVGAWDSRRTDGPKVGWRRARLHPSST